jgi:peptidoglycan hydrolase-like protein with peptidoglycan-binding domain
MLFKVFFRKLRCLKPDTYPFPTLPVLYLGFSQDTSQKAIETLQKILCDRGLLAKANGKFDVETKSAIEKFQQENELRVDGIVGSFTWAALLHSRLSYSRILIPELQEDVIKLQTLLQQEGFAVQVNGHFEKKTKRAVKQFQMLYRLSPDGVCGPMTWAVLLSQREKTAPRLSNISCVLSHYKSLPLEQLFEICSVCVGIYLSPLTLEPALAEMLVISYGLTFIVPFLLERLGVKLLVASIPLLRFAPYVLAGVLWESALNAVKLLIQKL